MSYMTTTAELTGLAERMLDTLRARREQGPTAYPLTLRRLAQIAQPEADERAVLQTANEEPFLAAAIVAQKNELDTFVALREDKAELAESPSLLQNVLDQVCTDENRLWPLDKLAGQLDGDLQEIFTESVQRFVQENRLPEPVGVQSNAKGPQLFLKRLPPAPPPRRGPDILADQLVEKLREQGRPGSPEFPLSMKRLIELSGTTDEKVAKKAVTLPAFLDHVAVVARKLPETPVALREDLPAMAASPRVLEFAMNTVCNEAKPPCAPDKIAAKLGPMVQSAIVEAVKRRIETKDVPEAVGIFAMKSGPVLYFKKWPPKVAPEVMLSQKLVETMEHLRQRNESYPLRLSELIRRAGVDPINDADMIKTALAKPPFAGRVMMAMKNDMESLIALTEDAERLAGSPLLLERLLTAVRTEENQSVPLADLVRPLNPALKEVMERTRLPETVGSVLFKGKRLVFLKSDMR